MCYRPPWIFGAVFEAAKAFIDPKTASKIVFVNGDDKDGSENDKKMHEVIGTQRRIDRKRREESSREVKRKRTERNKTKQNRTEQNREEENIGKEEGQAEKRAEQSSGEGSLSRPCSRRIQSQFQPQSVSDLDSVSATSCLHGCKSSSQYNCSDTYRYHKKYHIA